MVEGVAYLVGRCMCTRCMCMVQSVSWNVGLVCVFLFGCLCEILGLVVPHYRTLISFLFLSINDVIHVY